MLETDGAAMEWPLYLRDIIRYIESPERTVIGLMSGTSADGVTAVLARLRGGGRATAVEVLACETFDYQAPLNERIFDLFARETATADRIAQGDMVIGEAFADAAIEVTRRAGLTMQDVDLIASSGQITFQVIEGQRPEYRWLGDRAVTSFMTLGSGAVIAERTGVTTVTNIHQRDIAAGGQGVPALTYADWLLFGHPEKGRSIQNIGGIANPTIIPAGAAIEDVFSFDVGPGNMIIDALVTQMTEGRQAYDAGGRIASSGTVHAGLLQELLVHPFVRQAPPKAAARQVFGHDYASEVQARGEAFDLRPEDVIATVTAFTAEAIALGYREFVFPRAVVDEVFVAGGGAKNDTLMAHLARVLDPVPVRTIADLGVPVEGRESLGTAIIGSETILGRASNNPTTTGASHRVILGDISPSGATPAHDAT